MFKGSGLSELSRHNPELAHIRAENIGTKSNEYDKMYKIIMLGDTGIGKSCILKRLTEG
jgi:GTPase SAR1 family protein